MDNVFTNVFSSTSLDEIVSWVIDNHPDCTVIKNNKAAKTIECGPPANKYNPTIKLFINEYIDDNTDNFCYVARIVISYIDKNKKPDGFFGPFINTVNFIVMDNSVNFFNKFKTAFEMCYEPIKDNAIEKYEMYIENIKNFIAIEKLS